MSKLRTKQSAIPKIEQPNHCSSGDYGAQKTISHDLSNLWRQLAMRGIWCNGIGRSARWPIKGPSPSAYTLDNAILHKRLQIPERGSVRDPRTGHVVLRSEAPPLLDERPQLQQARGQRNGRILAACRRRIRRVNFPALWRENRPCFGLRIRPHQLYDGLGCRRT
jgi:hypothetical protein